MNAFSKFMYKIPREYEPQIERSISHAAAVLSDPNAPQEATEAILSELEHLNKTVGLDVVQAWKDELAEQIGLEASAMTRVLEMAENVRARAQVSPGIFWRHLKWWWKRDAVAVTVGAIAVVGVGGTVWQAVQDGIGFNSMQREFQDRLDLEATDVDLTRFDEEMAELARPNYPNLAPEISIPASVAPVPVQVILPNAQPIVPATQVIARLPDVSSQRRAVDFINSATVAKRSVAFSPRLNLPTGVAGGSTFGSFSILH